VKRLALPLAAITALAACGRAAVDKPTAASIEPIVVVRPNAPPPANLPAPRPAQVAPTPQTGTEFQSIFVQTLLLNPIGYRLVRNDACAPHVNLAMSAYQATNVAPALRAARVHEALLHGYQAGCFVPKTAVELLPTRVREYWSSNRARLIQSKECGPYTAAADTVAMSGAAESERIYQLTRMFSDAAARGCMRQQETGTAAN